MNFSTEQCDADFSSVTKIKAGVLYAKFYGGNITSADLSNVVEIEENGLKSTFENSQLETVDLSNLEIAGRTALYYAFANSKIKRLYLPKLTTTSLSLADCCLNSEVESFEVPNIESVNGTVFNDSCSECYKLKKVNLDKLQSTSGTNSLYSFALLNSNNNVLKYMNFKSLSSITGSSTLGYAFQKRDEICLYFPSLTTSSFGSYTNHFNNMLQYAIGATVFFPSSIENTIGSWASVTGGFGGTNTTIIFYIPTMIKVVPTQTTASVLSYGSYNNEENVITKTTSTIEYVVYDEALNKAFLGVETGCTEGEIRTNNIDLTSYSYDTLTWNTGVSGGTLSVIWNNINIPLTETSSGNYSIKTNTSSGETISLSMVNDSDYEDITSSITTNGSDITQSATLTPRTYNSWTRPNLSADGTIGGSSFAVVASNVYGSNYAYKAVDSSTSTYWSSSSSSGDTPTFTIYNPKLLKVSSFVFKWNSVYNAKKIVLECSNDNSNWEKINEYTISTTSDYTATITNPKGYKYYRFTLTKNYNYVRISNITINATESST